MNKIRPDTTPVTALDVARLANVSRSAVSRSFTPGASVSEKTRQKVYKAAQELGYRVNMVARGLNKQRTDIVGMIASRMDNPCRAKQIDALAKRLVREGFRPMLLMIDEDNSVEELLSTLLNYRVSGVVITSDAPPVEICNECARMRVPLALVDRADDLPFVDRVNGNDRAGGRMAADALLEAGRQSFVAVRQETLGYSGQVRLSAFAERIARAGHETRFVTVGENEYEAGAEAAASVAAMAGERPGVFCPSDSVALGLLDHLKHRHGVDIPGEVGVVGYDDVPQASWAFADLTTVRQSVDEFARATVDLLKDRAENPELAPRLRVIDVSLVRRGSA